jgi:hypothetical protein
VHDDTLTEEARFSLQAGDCAAMVRARRGLAAVPGAGGLLRSMVHCDARRRPSMRAALLGPAFAGMRRARHTGPHGVGGGDVGGDGGCGGGEGGGALLRYAAYAGREIRDV